MHSLLEKSKSEQDVSPKWGFSFLNTQSETITRTPFNKTATSRMLSSPIGLLADVRSMQQGRDTNSEKTQSSCLLGRMKCDNEATFRDWSLLRMMSLL